MLIHKNNKTLRNKEVKWPKRHSDVQSVGKLNTTILHPDVHGFSENPAFGDKIKSKMLNVEISEVKNGNSLFDQQHHLNKIQKIVDGLQDEIIRNQKIERLEESQRNKKHSELLNFEINQVKIINNDNK